MRYEPEVKKSPPHLLQRFAVCDIPLYAICDYVSRDRCEELGCCFYKSVCYEKALPVYVYVFSILLVVIAAAFIVTIVYKIVQERRRQKEMLAEDTLSPKASTEPVEASLGGQVSTKMASGSVSKSGENMEEEESADMEPEDTEG